MFATSSHKPQLLTILQQVPVVERIITRHKQQVTFCIVSLLLLIYQYDVRSFTCKHQYEYTTTSTSHQSTTLYFQQTRNDNRKHHTKIINHHRSDVCDCKYIFYWKSSKRIYATGRDNDETTTSSTTTSSRSTELSMTKKLDVAIEFEQWIQKFHTIKQNDEKDKSIDKIFLHESVRHSLFNNKQLRGLQWISSSLSSTSIQPSKINSLVTIAKIPRAATISSKVSTTETTIPNLNLLRPEEWDTILALKLWNEIQLQHNSRFWGYCHLLLSSSSSSSSSLSSSSSSLSSTVDNYEMMTSTSPHAVRHWTTLEHNILLQTDAGRRLVQYNTQQQDKWKDKYTLLLLQNIIKNNLDNSTTSSTGSTPTNITITYEQFYWCMECVHSRSFTGVTGTDNPITLSAFSGTLIPIIGAILILLSSTSLDTNPNTDYLLVGTCILVAISSFIPSNNLFNIKTTMHHGTDAVFLPIIDSANHNNDATDSKIEYNPLTNQFELSIGPNSIDTTNNQIFVRYGTKSDTELLLNYGFLSNVYRYDNDTDTTYRQRLAYSFNSRNSD